MMELKNLIRLDRKMAMKALDMGTTGELKVYIIDTNTSIPVLLKVRDLELIRKVQPRRTEITLEPPPCPGTIGRFTRAGYEDLRVSKADHEKFFTDRTNEAKEAKKENLPPEAIDLSKNKYYQGLTIQAQRAVFGYSQWKVNNTIKKNMMSQVVEPILNTITSDTREVEIFKRILKAEFEELE